MFALTAGSCNYLVSPRRGRWNVLDPITVDPTLEIYRIIQPWDTSNSITTVNMPGVFYDDDHMQRVVIQQTASEVVVPLTDAYSGSSSSLEWGIVIFAPVELVQFEHSEGPIPPLLLIEPS
jgi:hypothetical protein